MESKGFLKRMKEENRKWHLETMSLHQSNLYSTLIYPYHVKTETLKEIDFDNGFTGRGFFAIKDKQKYFIDEDIFPRLPIRVNTQVEELLHKEDVIIRPLAPTPFKITPQATMTFRTFIDSYLSFSHTEPQHWLLLKLIAIASFVGRTYICIASLPNFGKSSVFDVLHNITDKVPVFKPRSVPGVLNQINGNGNLVFDEVHDCKKEIKEIMEEFALQVGGGKSMYINGALRSSKTQTKYNCSLQSITFLYNNVESYRNPEKEYFEVIFSNNKAIDNRFLKFKMKGELTEKFDRDFNLIAEAELNKMYYINCAKMLLFLQELKHKNGYTRKFQATTPLLKLRGRRKNILDEITWCIDMYADTQVEYDNLYNELEMCITDYKEMVHTLKDEPLEVVNETVHS